MSKTLVLEIQDEVYSSVQKRAKQKGSTAEAFVIESIVKNLSNNELSVNEPNPIEARKDLMKFAGAVSSGVRARRTMIELIHISRLNTAGMCKNSPRKLVES